MGAQCHYRTDVPHKSRLGFVAQDFEGAGVTGTARHEDRNLMTLDYARLTAVLGRLQVASDAGGGAGEARLKAKTKARHG